MQCTCAVLSSVACPALLKFSAVTHTRQDCRGEGGVIQYKMCMIFSTKFAWNIPHSRKKRARYDHKGPAVA
jgi:hypothetical protein